VNSTADCLTIGNRFCGFAQEGYDKAVNDFALTHPKYNGAVATYVMTNKNCVAADCPASATAYSPAATDPITIRGAPDTVYRTTDATDTTDPKCSPSYTLYSFMVGTSAGARSPPWGASGCLVTAVPDLTWQAFAKGFASGAYNENYGKCLDGADDAKKVLCAYILRIAQASMLCNTLSCVTDTVIKGVDASCSKDLAQRACTGLQPARAGVLAAAVSQANTDLTPSIAYTLANALTGDFVQGSACTDAMCRVSTSDGTTSTTSTSTPAAGGAAGTSLVAAAVVFGLMVSVLAV